MSKKGEDSAVRKVDAISLTSTVEKKLKSVFLDTKTVVANSGIPTLTSGLCWKISVSSLASQLSNVYIQLPRPSTDELFPPAMWSAKFAGFLPVAQGQSCQLSSKYGKCFKLDLNANNGLGLSKVMMTKLDPVFEINIKPIVTNPASDISFGEINPEPNGLAKYDLKAIGFEYTIKTTYKSGADTSSSSLGRGFIRGFIWAGDLGVCDDPTTSKRISLTANAFGDPDNNTVFNQAGFRSDSLSSNTNPPLELTPINSQIRSGVIGGTLGSQFLQSQDQVSNTNPDSGPVYSACNERSFRCVQKFGTEREYQSIRNLIRAGYVVPNVLINSGSSIQIAPKVIFKNKSEVELPVTFAQSFDLGGRTYRKGPNDNWYYTSFGPIKIPMLIGEEQTITANLSDVNDNLAGNSICRNICVATSNYNSNPTNHYTSTFSYKVKAGALPPGTVDTFSISTGPVGCTACYMKNCDQFGLGTFGVMHNQPTEPLDVGVPECVQYENHVSNFYELYPAPSEVYASSCLSAKLKNGDNNGLEFISESCSTQLPVLCFAFGKHMLAREVLRPSSSAPAGSEALVNGNYDAANEICFRLGREDIKKAPFKTLLTQDGNLDASGLEILGISAASDDISPDATMVVMNFITQGSFFSPVGLNQETSLRDYADKSGDKPTLLSQKFWVGLKVDNAGYVYAPAPEIPTDALDPNVKWGIHFDGKGETVVRKISESLYLNSSSDSKNYGLLFHTPRFKGVKFVQKNKPYGQAANENLRVLCREKNFPHNIYISSQKTNKFDEAGNICKNSNGVFLPPLTTSGWEVAYQLVNPNHPKHPFPSAWAESELNPVWVNVKSDTGMDVGEMFNQDQTKYINFEGKFLAPSEEPANAAKACFNQSKGEIVIRSSCASSERLPTVDEISKAKNTSNFYFRFMMKMALANWSGGEVGIIQVAQ
jgi:hypothetical protein